MLTRASDFYRKHERWAPIAAFLAGFLFDAVMLQRIDELKVIVQQALYLLVAGVLVGVELIEETREIETPRLLAKIWKYREPVLHFLLGTLLNSYAIFYFKSASAFTSFFFIALLVTLLTLNEFQRFGKSQSQVHVAFLSLCLVSFLISLAPIMMGFVGTVPFLCAVGATLAVFAAYYAVLRPRLATAPELLRSHLLYPFAAIQVIFVGLYFAHLIPPVPLSVKYMGIYHAVEKKDGEYELAYTRSPWKFWQHGDQTFRARPGDSIICFAQVFSPTRFKDNLQVRWLYEDEKRGWLSADAIPLPVVGGRDEGYRSVTKKTNFQPGAWRVQIETMDNREIGRIGFDVVADDSQDERELHKVIR